MLNRYFSAFCDGFNPPQLYNPNEIYSTTLDSQFNGVFTSIIEMYSLDNYGNVVFDGFIPESN